MLQSLITRAQLRGPYRGLTPKETMSRIYLSPPHMGPNERALLLDAFDSNWIAPLGPHVDAFEREFAATVGIEHACALSSGTAALHLALALVNVGPGDDVFVSDLTFAATVNAIKYLGANPVFIDSELRTWNMDWELLESALKEAAARGRLPRAVIVVDLYGQCAEYEHIQRVCDRYGVPIIEDAAEALGATRKERSAGSFGTIGVFSFNGNKIITTSGGGMLTSSDATFVTRARHLATQAREPAPHYEHQTIGYNYRLSNLLAAVGRGQLAVLPDRIRARRQNNREYRRLLANVSGVHFMPLDQQGEWNGWLTCVLIDAEEFGVDREQVRLALEHCDIESRPLWKPMHMQPVFAPYRAYGGSVSRVLFESGLCLPSGSALSPDDIERVVRVMLSAQQQPRPSQDR